MDSSALRAISALMVPDAVAVGRLIPLTQVTLDVVVE
jgi:hypothetical protein